MSMETYQFRRVGPYHGNGVTVDFTFDFLVFEETDVAVTEYDTALLVESTLVYNVDYTVALNADQDTNPGGTVTALIAPAAGIDWTLTSNIEATQPLNASVGGSPSPQVLETAYDRCVALIQQLMEVLSRSVTFPISVSINGSLPTPVAFYRLGWSADATHLVNYSPGQGDTTVVNVWEAAQVSKPVVLVSGASVAVNAALGNNFTLTTANTFTLQNPSNLRDGQILNFRIKQDGTGSRIITWGSKYKFPGGTPGVLTTAANAVDFMSCYYDLASDTLDCVLNKDFK